jgi:hypothetical protein
MLARMPLLPMALIVSVQIVWRLTVLIALAQTV